MPRPNTWLLLTALCLFPSLLQSAEPEPPAPVATPGEPAPPLVVSGWVRGEPVETFKAGRIYVVDLWSTWCKPCLATMPLLSRTQMRHKNDVTVIGMNVWEMKPEGVPAYVKSHADSMAITVAMDSIPPGKEVNEGLTAVAYLGTSALASIPRTFLIDRKGRVAWIGTPEGLEEPLTRLIDGTWDVEVFAEKHAADLRIEQRYQKHIEAVEKAMAAADWEGVLQAAEAAVAEDASFGPRIAHNGFAYLAMTILRLPNPEPPVIAAADRAARRSLELEPKPDWRLHQLAASTARAAGNLEAARGHLKRAMEIAQGDDLKGLEKELEALGKKE